MDAGGSLHGHKRAFELLVARGPVPSTALRAPVRHLPKSRRNVRQGAQGCDEGVGPVVERIARTFDSFDAVLEIPQNRLNFW
jgi:hypothetical protein